MPSILLPNPRNNDVRKCLLTFPFFRRKIMTNRERFLAALNGTPTERLPMIEWAGWWDKTISNWETQGFPLNAGRDEGYHFWGLDLHDQHWISPQSPDCPKPAGHGKGIMETEADYEKLLPFLYQDTSIDRMVEWMKRMKPRHESGESVIWWTFEGFFWYPRTLLGIEPHLYAFYDQPELMHRINQDLLAFNLKALEAAVSVFSPDFMTIAEDMSYNKGPMLSKSRFDEFVAPYYKQLVPELKKYGIRVLVDTDGDVEPIIPWFAECGIQGVIPLERQSHVDVARIRQNHPEWLMIGGYDKTIMHLGEEAMRKEFERLLPTMKKGRYIPAVDHQTPPDVSLENYRIYMRLLAEYTRRAAMETE